jgi:hypothetical protein
MPAILLCDGVMVDCQGSLTGAADNRCSTSARLRCSN